MGTTRLRSHHAAAPTVHPHARGDHGDLIEAISEKLGSPPRPWGPRHIGFVHWWRFRFTPTPVGTTSSTTTTRTTAPVHPHARGDHKIDLDNALSNIGSPPRPWGPRGVIVTRHSPFRFTPTPVGTTGELLGCRPRPPVHPHARGDHGVVASDPFSAYGSPPRPWGPRTQGNSTGQYHWFTPHARGDHQMSSGNSPPCVGSPPRPWGPPAGMRKRRRTPRFTPTPVGTTAGPSCRHHPLTVHPHARGDHHRASAFARSPVGSPPRPWGPLVPGFLGVSTPRFTPTPVGTTLVLDNRTDRLSVHPHARGDHGSRRWSVRWLIGSPPRPWGPRMVDPEEQDRSRFTPTPVGTTRPGDRRAGQRPVHPHARGDHVSLPVLRRFRRGSPPRPWGPHLPNRSWRPPGRFTPTPVGTTSSASMARPTHPVHPHARGDHRSGQWRG